MVIGAGEEHLISPFSMRLYIVMRNRVNGVLEEPEIEDLDDEDFEDDEY
jgi:hypothetical protein